MKAMHRNEIIFRFMKGDRIVLVGLNDFSVRFFIAEKINPAVEAPLPSPPAPAMVSLRVRLLLCWLLCMRVRVEMRHERKISSRFASIPQCFVRTRFPSVLKLLVSLGRRSPRATATGSLVEALSSSILAGVDRVATPLFESLAAVADRLGGPPSRSPPSPILAL
jgi:hypothetical protein